MIINGRKIAEQININTAKRIKKLIQHGFVPKIAVILVGSRSESEIYVRQKESLAKKLGFAFNLIRFSENASEKKISAELMHLQNTKDISGVIVQLPLPGRIDAYRILSCLLPEYDIDCLSDISLGRLILRNNLVEPPTAGAVLEILKYLKINLSGKKIVVVGAGLLVGKPLVMMLMNSQATVFVCNSETRNLASYCRDADIIISGAGKKNLIKPSMVKKNAVVIDAGFSYKNGKVFGDAAVAKLDKKGVKVTPTPGGVGPVTVAKLMRNAIICAEQKFLH